MGGGEQYISKKTEDDCSNLRSHRFSGFVQVIQSPYLLISITGVSTAMMTLQGSRHFSETHKSLFRSKQWEKVEVTILAPILHKHPCECMYILKISSVTYIFPQNHRITPS